MNLNLAEHIKGLFINKFGNNPILVSAPGRINLIGEHTDYNEGFVFPAAIDKSNIVAISKSDSELCTVYANDLNEEYQFTLDDLKPLTSNSWINYVIGVVAETVKYGSSIHPFNLIFGGDIPVGAGLSSSAALENSIVFGLNELFQLKISKREMIFISQKAEHNYAGVKCGIMDQFTSMYGIEDHALLLDCRSLEYEPFKVDFNNYKLVLVNSNVSHSLAENAYNERRSVCEKVASLLNVKALRDASINDLNELKQVLTEGEYQKALYIIQENLRVKKAVELLKENELKAFGDLLFEAHVGMKDQFKISCAELDFLVDKAKENPWVIGSRMIGGGFGGCTLNIVDKKGVDDFVVQIKAAYLEKFELECSVYFVKLSNGTQLVE